MSKTRAWEYGCWQGAFHRLARELWNERRRSAQGEWASALESLARVIRLMRDRDRQSPRFYRRKVDWPSSLIALAGNLRQERDRYLPSMEWQGAFNQMANSLKVRNRRKT